MTDTAGTAGPAADSLTLAVPAGSRCQLEREYREMFPGHHPNELIGAEWQSASAHGATLEWAWRVADAAAVTEKFRLYLVRCALRIASEIPVDIIDGLLWYGWTLIDLSDLSDLFGLNRSDDGRLDSTGIARRLLELHRAVPGIGGSDGSTLWCALAAVMTVGQAGLTDLQTLRWLQALVPSEQRSWTSQFSLAKNLDLDGGILELIQEWVLGTGPDGWLWPTAGYTINEAQVVFALPAGHPDRPGPEQLAVMAALRDR